MNHKWSSAGKIGFFIFQPRKLLLRVRGALGIAVQELSQLTQPSPKGTPCFSYFAEYTGIRVTTHKHILFMAAEGQEATCRATISFI